MNESDLEKLIELRSKTILVFEMLKEMHIVNEELISDLIAEEDTEVNAKCMVELMEIRSILQKVSA